MTPTRSHLALTALVLFALSAPLAGCSKRDASSGTAPAAAAAAPASGTTQPAGQKLGDIERERRKVIKNASLSMRVDSPASAARKAGEIAERHGGYLASSDADESANDDGSEPMSVNVTIRVNADDLDGVLNELRALAKHVGSERITSQDVTEEWMDLDARLKTQKKLEEQYQEIAKGASKVDDLLAVQKQLAEVRGEIEKIEGRKRYLENQVALSTVTLRFEQERPLVSVSGSAFPRAIRRAAADCVSVGANIVIGSIRIAGVMLPVVLLVFLPLYLFARALLRRLNRPA